MSKTLLIVISIALLGGLAVFLLNDPLTESQNQNAVSNVQELSEQTPVEVTEEVPAQAESVEEYVATLTDVTQGEEVDGFSTNGEASGTATAYFSNQYMLSAQFENLPELTPDFFYEGWVVRLDASGTPESVISTGALEVLGDGTYANTFSSPEDYTDHTRYVLTLEPDDGDPAPAGHIVEGTFTR